MSRSSRQRRHLEVLWALNGDAGDTRYMSLANPLHFPKLDGRPADRRFSSRSAQGRNRNDAMPPGNAFSALYEHIGPYHKTTSNTTSCEALPASSFPFKMGRWDIVYERSI